MPGIVRFPEYLNTQYVFKYLNTKMSWVFKYTISLNLHKTKNCYLSKVIVQSGIWTQIPFITELTHLFPSLLHSFPPRQSCQDPSGAWTCCYPLGLSTDYVITKLGLISKEPRVVIIYQTINRFNWAN